jgi:hypothetical protein
MRVGRGGGGRGEGEQGEDGLEHGASGDVRISIVSGNAAARRAGPRGRPDRTSPWGSHIGVSLDPKEKVDELSEVNDYKALPLAFDDPCR